MPRILSGGISTVSPISDLIACDPTGLNTENIPITTGQGRLGPGTLLQRTGARATSAADVHGVLHEFIDTDNTLQSVPPASGAAVYTKGRFNRVRVKEANPALTINAAFEDEMRTKGITLEWPAGWESRPDFPVS